MNREAETILALVKKILEKIRNQGGKSAKGPYQKKCYQSNVVKCRVFLISAAWHKMIEYS